MPPYDTDDSDVDNLIADARYIAKTQNLPLVKCAFFGVECTDAFVVPVVVQVDKQEQNTGRPYDLMFRNYVNTDKSRHTIVFNLDKHMIEVEDWPPSGGTPSEWQWTIFVSKYVLDEDNQLIKTFHGGRDLEVPGCLLVAKSDRSGHLVNVELGDTYFIKAMLVDVLTTQYP